MPKVRDSSGTIGTTNLPICLSCMSLRMTATKAIVVANSRLPELFLNSSHSVSAGMASGGAITCRWGTEPPRLSRRWRMYCISGLSSGGR